MFIFIYVYGCFVHLYGSALCICTWCLLRPEERTGSPGSGGTDSYRPLLAVPGTNRLSGRAAHTLTREPAPAPVWNITHSPHSQAIFHLFVGKDTARTSSRFCTLRLTKQGLLPMASSRFKDTGLAAKDRLLEQFSVLLLIIYLYSSHRALPSP